MGIEDIIRWNESIEEDEKLIIHLSASLIYCSRVVDLLRSTKEDTKYSRSIIESQDLVEIAIKDEYDVKKLLKIILKEIQRAEPELGASMLEEAAHVVFSVKLYKRRTTGLENFAQVDLVKLSGSEYASNSKLADSAVHQFAVSSFNSLSAELLSVGLCRAGHKRSQSSALVPLLSRTLSPYSKILLIVCVEEGSEQSLPALKFVSQIRECIYNKKLKKSARFQQNQEEFGNTTGGYKRDIDLPTDFQNIDTRRADEWIEKKELEINALMGTIKKCLQDQNEETNLLLQKKHAELLEAKKDLSRVRDIISARTGAKGKENVGLTTIGNKIERLQMSVEKYDRGIADVMDRIDSLERKVSREKAAEKDYLEHEIIDLKNKQILLEAELEDKLLKIHQNEEETLRQKSEFEDKITELVSNSRQKESEYQRDIETLQGKVQSLQDELKIMEVRHRENLKEEQEKLKQSQDVLEQEKEMKEKVKRTFETKEQEFSHRMQQLQLESEQAQETFKENLKKLRKQLEEEKDTSEGYYRELRLYKQELENTKEDLERTKSDHNKRLLYERSRSETAEEDLAKTVAEIKGLIKDNNELKQIIEEQKGAISTLESTVSTLKLDKAKLENQVTDRVAEIDALKQSTGRHKEHLQVLQDELEDKVKQISAIQREFNETLQAKEQQSVELQGIIEERKGVVKQEQEKYESMKEENEKLKSDNMYLMNKTSQQKEEIEQLKSHVEHGSSTNEKELILIENKYDTINAEMKRLMAGYTEQTEKEKKYKRMIEEMEQKMKEITEKCEKLKQRKGKYKFKLEEAEKRIKELEFELALEMKSSRGKPYVEPRAYVLFDLYNRYQQDLENIRDKIRSIKSQKQYKPQQQYIQFKAQPQVQPILSIYYDPLECCLLFNSSIASTALLTFSHKNTGNSGWSIGYKQSYYNEQSIKQLQQVNARQTLQCIRRQQSAPDTTKLCLALFIRKIALPYLHRGINKSSHEFAAGPCLNDTQDILNQIRRCWQNRWCLQRVQRSSWTFHWPYD
eukprot:TRINITY_DN18196_c0_g2_i1.p2 TRINITY_DN18196_c0_g2~~TRINITY_DN18196_c0_g2_i1.p2  ORF type:complete len:1026 (-),score=157.92 TRINITY_DN18196_c0_g2_i1:246-3323(-)